jgi:hypothetical protein
VAIMPLVRVSMFILRFEGVTSFYSSARFSEGQGLQQA